jgi:hypothetical protein
MLFAAALLLPHLTGSQPPDSIALLKPGVQRRVDVASASTRPWVNANGWRLERGSAKPFFYDVAGDTAALAAAEAFAYQREAAVHTDAAGTASFERMTAFLKTLEPGPEQVRANVGVIDDGSSQTGEVMNLLARHNILFLVESAPRSDLAVNIKLGSKEFPVFDAANPNEFAQKIRQRITDEKRILRIYGSDVVLARLTGDSSRARLHLINYGGRPVYGLRVRVLGNYPQRKLALFDVPDAQIQDYEVLPEATEFTLPVLRTYGVVDLFSK